MPPVASPPALVEPADPLAAQLRAWVSEAEAQRLRQHLRAQTEAAGARLRDVGATAGLDDAIADQVRVRLMDLTARHLTLSAGDLERRVLDFEVFKAETFVRSGVYPRRYFGYLDNQGDTARWEAQLRTTTRASVRAANAWLADEGEPWRVTDQEVIVTFLSEGGALYLQQDSPRLEQWHPVFDVGLDDLASGDHDMASLMARLDAAAGTGLAELVAWVPEGASTLPVPSVVPNEVRWLMARNTRPGERPYLVRYMTFPEAVAGTTMMWVWEKRIAQRKLLNQGLPGMPSRTPEDQYIIGSLVYNSGLLHGPDRWEMIHGFSAGAWLKASSDQNRHRRPELPVLLPQDGLALLTSGGTYPDQGTSWLATYHILQRWGGYAALSRFTDHFTPEGALTADPPLVLPPPATTAPEATPQGTGPLSPGCASAAGGSAWAGALGAALGVLGRWLRRRRPVNPT